MAIFGYIMYIIICLWVSVICFATFSWPGHNGPERLGAIAVMALVWFGAYSWAPFSLVT